MAGFILVLRFFFPTMEFLSLLNKRQEIIFVELKTALYVWIAYIQLIFRCK